MWLDLAHNITKPFQILLGLLKAVLSIRTLHLKWTDASSILE